MKRTMRLHLLVFAVFFGSMGVSLAQGEHPTEEKDSTLCTATSFIEVFQHAHLHGHVRNYFMSTLNEGALTDYFSNATGGAIAMTTKRYKGFKFGVKGIFTYQTFSSNLNAFDSIGGGASKWEHELYDIEDTDNFHDLDRLEELYLTYHFKKGFFSFGKFEFQDTPLINESDGRMKPFVFKGASLNLNLKKQQKLALTALYGVSPRSTVEWYDFNEAIGLVNNGSTRDGHSADYHGETHSRGAFVVDYEKEWEKLNVHFYNIYLDRINNSSWLEGKLKLKSWTIGTQVLFQLPMGNMAQSDEFQYIEEEEQGMVVSTLIEKHQKSARWSVAYTHAFDSGRFLFPKALGRDQFYTSISRSRLEGLGDADVITVKYEQKFKKTDLTTLIECTAVLGAEPEDHRFNKYGIDDYVQMNARLNYHFHGFLEGLDMALLYVVKQNLYDSTPEELFNVSNYQQINFVTNFNF